MARRRNRETLDDELNDKRSQFESGIDRREDEDLDDLIWEMGGYENDAPQDERAEFEKEVPPADEELTDELDEKGERLEEDTSAAVEPEISLLRLEIGGEEMEVVCGQISNSLRKRLERECDIEQATLEDIWYDNEKMKRIAVEGWSAWYQVDEFYHEIGLSARSADALSINGLLDGEPIEDFDPDDIEVVKSDTQPRPRARKNFSAIVAGTLNEGRFIYEQDITGEFDISKLEFVFTDLRWLGISVPLLTEVRYDGEPMYYEHEVTQVKDMLDVQFLKA